MRSRSDDDGNWAALLGLARIPAGTVALIGYLNVEVAKYEATSNAENQG
jgi:hypothetical protein